MSILFSVLIAIKSFFTFPIHVWNNGVPDCYTVTYQVGRQLPHTEHNCFPPSPDHSTGLVLGLLVYGFTIYMVVVMVQIGRILYKRHVFKRDSRPCQHCQKKTLQLAEVKHWKCTTKKHCCRDCDYNHRYQEFPDKECSVHGIVMKVIPFRDKFFHWCPECSDITLPLELSADISRLLTKYVDCDLIAAITDSYDPEDVMSDS